MTNYDSARDYVAALDDRELSAFIREARQPSQLTREDVAKLHANRQYQAIEDARTAGRLNQLMNGEQA